MNKRKIEFKAFTLVELLVSMTILSLILLVATGVINQTQKTWLQGSARVEQFREARMAFETISDNLRQATLNTYTTYRYNDGVKPTIPNSVTEAPTQYIRHSELQFNVGRANDMLTGPGSGDLNSHAVFFQAPLGVTQNAEYTSLKSLLCGRGYFVMFGDDSAYRPDHVTQSRARFRLMEYRPPAEQNRVYNVEAGQWYDTALADVVKSGDSISTPAATRPVAENIIALIISPRVAVQETSGTPQKPTWIAPNYSYNSSLVVSPNLPNNPQGFQHLLPPSLVVTLVAIDEASARRLQDEHGDSSPGLVSPSAFTNADKYEDDLAELEATLLNEKISYRVFSTTIELRNAKWNLY